MQNKKVSFFQDLAGSNFITIPHINTLESLDRQLKSSIDYFLDNHTNKDKIKIRIIFDDYSTSQIKHIAEKQFLNHNTSKINIKLYDTNFFYLDKLNVEQKTKNIQLGWLEYADEFVTIEVLEYSDKNTEIIKNFVINSFASKFEKINGKTSITINEAKADYLLKNFHKSFENQSITSYLVKNKNGEFVGTYSLTLAGEEVQVSSVAGISDLPQAYQKKGKLPILCSSMVDQFTKNSRFKDSKQITLSNSKEPIANKYQNIGFSSNTKRKGLFIEIYSK